MNDLVIFTFNFYDFRLSRENLKFHEFLPFILQILSLSYSYNSTLLQMMKVEFEEAFHPRTICSRCGGGENFHGKFMFTLFTFIFMFPKWTNENFTWSIFPNFHVASVLRNWENSHNYLRPLLASWFLVLIGPLKIFSILIPWNSFSMLYSLSNFPLDKL